jgi:hypothetical protein
MPRVHLIIARQITEPLQALQLLIHIAAGKIGSAAAASKERVTREQCVLTDNTDTAGGMSGCGDNLKTEPGKAKNITVVIIAAALRQHIGIVAVTGGMRIVTRTEIDRRTGLFHDCVYGTDMVAVAVGEEDCFTVEFVFF